jgi:hypothetical protein
LEIQRQRDQKEHQYIVGWINVKIDLGEIGWGNVDWFGLAQDRDKWRALVNTAMNLQVA